MMNQTNCFKLFKQNLNKLFQKFLIFDNSRKTVLFKSSINLTWFNLGQLFTGGGGGSFIDRLFLFQIRLSLNFLMKYK